MLESWEVTSVAGYRDRPYEFMVGTARFAVDPGDPANAPIVDLDLAPRDADGRVRFSADVRLLRPTDRGNGRALVVIPNRGMLGGIPFSLGAALEFAPTADPDPGDGFLLDRGWTIGWCGWQWDVVREKGWLGLDAPVAVVEPGWMRVEFRPDTTQPDHRLSDSSPLFEFRDYPTAAIDDGAAQLTARTTPVGPGEPLPRSSWRFTTDARIELDGGFQPFHWYELVYRSAFAPVVGAGLIAVRDFGSWLRRSNEGVFSFGVSQAGRFLRQFLHDGLNLDETGAAVFDGVLAHIASARRGEFNCRYGQPSLTHPLNPGYGPPYETTALLRRQRQAGGVPKLMLTNSAWEYWRGDGALVHQDAGTGEDLPDDPDGRAYLLAGTDHLGAVPIKDFLPGANPKHTLDATPVVRALFLDLEAWACDGVAPPPSMVPRRADGTAVAREDVLGCFAGVARPDPAHLPWTPLIDPTSTSWPLELGAPRVALVSAVDEGGNEVAGIRLPAVAVPVAAFTGWNPRVPVDGLPDVLYEFLGSRLPLQSAGAPMARPAYEAAVQRAAQALVDARVLLAVDVRRVSDEAMRLYDEETA